jgi:hypothetical protein
MTTHLSLVSENILLKNETDTKKRVYKKKSLYTKNYEWNVIN